MPKFRHSPKVGSSPNSRLRAMATNRRALQTHGMSSQVYVPILLKIFRKSYVDGAIAVTFTLDDVRNAAIELGITIRNPADLVYRMRSRTVLPKEILDLGFYVLRQSGRGRYVLEKASTTIIELPDNQPQGTLDLTPLPVRRLLPEKVAEFDEQALLTVVGYCKILDHFTGLTNFRLRSHVRKSVPGIGQAELDEISVAVVYREDETPVIIPVEAKAVADAINRVQINTMVAFCRHYFPGNELRPIAIKVDYDSIVHIVEFNATTRAADLEVVRSGAYSINLSEAQRALIRETEQRLV
jgi:hypothetical protein